MTIRIGRWDCKACGHKGNPGPEIHCEQCGSPRSKDVEFYLPDDAEVVTEETRLREAQAGVNWTCSHCSAANKATDSTCHSCGNSRGDKDDVDLQVTEYSLEDTPKSSRDFKKDKNNERSLQPSTPVSADSAGLLAILKKGLKIIGIIVGALAGLFLVLFVYNRATDIGSDIKFKDGWKNIEALSAQTQQFSHRASAITIDTTIEITGFRWERRILLEKLVDVPYEGDAVPAGSRLISQQQVIDRYDQVPNGTVTKTRNISKQVQTGTRRYKCGTISKGNGYFEDKMCEEAQYKTVTEQESYQETVYKSVPVYKTHYRYTTPEWHYDRTLTTQGKDRQPAWHAVTISSSREREASRSETLFIRYHTPKGSDIEDSVTAAVWNKYDRPGTKIKVKQRLLDPNPIPLAQQ